MSNHRCGRSLSPRHLSRRVLAHPHAIGPVADVVPEFEEGGTLPLSAVRLQRLRKEAGHLDLLFGGQIFGDHGQRPTGRVTQKRVLR
jgi:hypothetical protein